MSESTNDSGSTKDSGSMNDTGSTSTSDSLKNRENSKFRIVLIDDEPSVLRALSLLLQAIGYEATTFDHPSKAIEFFGTPECPKHDLILCDLKMPVFDGIGVLEHRNKLCPDLPFVLMSAHATSQDVEQALKLGAVGFLGKPFTPEQVNELISDLKAAA